MTLEEALRALVLALYTGGPISVDTMRGIQEGLNAEDAENIAKLTERVTGLESQAGVTSASSAEAGYTKAEIDEKVKTLTDKQTELETKQGQLETKQSDLDGKVTTAQGKADAADTKATSAETKATSAEGKATEAETKATSAESTAKEAETKAGTAESKATTADETAKAVKATVDSLTEKLHVGDLQAEADASQYTITISRKGKGEGGTYDQDDTSAVTLSAASAEKAGVMSAEDKKTLDKLKTDLEALQATVQQLQSKQAGDV